MWKTLVKKREAKVNLKSKSSWLSGNTTQELTWTFFISDLSRSFIPISLSSEIYHKRKRKTKDQLQRLSATLIWRYTCASSCQRFWLHDWTHRIWSYVCVVFAQLVCVNTDRAAVQMQSSALSRFSQTAEQQEEEEGSGAADKHLHPDDGDLVRKLTEAFRFVRLVYCVKLLIVD